MGDPEFEKAFLQIFEEQPFESASAETLTNHLHARGFDRQLWEVNRTLGDMAASGKLKVANSYHEKYKPDS